MNIHDACDYVITKICEGDAGLNHLKLHKLMYFLQAWRLAFEEKRLFDGRFQAWIHGPVSRELYDRFLKTKSLYSPITLKDRRPSFDLERLDPEERNHIDTILEAYGDFSGTQLEEMTHGEEPWKAARTGCRPSERCENLIDEASMKEYYASRMKK